MIPKEEEKKKEVKKVKILRKRKEIQRVEIQPKKKEIGKVKKKTREDLLLL